MKNFIKTLFTTNQLEENVQVDLILNTYGEKPVAHLLNVTASMIDQVGLPLLASTTAVAVGLNFTLAMKYYNNTVHKSPIKAIAVTMGLGMVAGAMTSQIILGEIKRQKLIGDQTKVV